MGSIAIFLLSLKGLHESMVLLNWSILNNDITIKQKTICTLVVLEVRRLDKSTDCPFEGINKAVVSNIYQSEIKYSHSSINFVRTHSSKCFLLVGTKWIFIFFSIRYVAARLINVIDTLILLTMFSYFLVSKLFPLDCCFSLDKYLDTSLLIWWILDSEVSTGYCESQKLIGFLYLSFQILTSHAQWKV